MVGGKPFAVPAVACCSGTGVVMRDPARHDIEATGWQVECWGSAASIKARLFYRGEQFGPVFEATSPRAIAARIARYLAEVAASLEERPQ